MKYTGYKIIKMCDNYTNMTAKDQKGKKDFPF